MAAGKGSRCPNCGAPTDPAFRPFCSQRCRNIDLGAWANEEFRMPAQTPPEDASFGDPRTED